MSDTESEVQFEENEDAPVANGVDESPNDENVIPDVTVEQFSKEPFDDGGDDARYEDNHDDADVPSEQLVTNSNDCPTDATDEPTETPPSDPVGDDVVDSVGEVKSGHQINASRDNEDDRF